MNRILFILLGVTAACSAMRFWQFWIGIRLAIYDVLNMMFCAMFFLWAGSRGKKFELTKETKMFLALSWAFLAVAGFSSITIWIKPLGNIAWEQYGKVLLSLAENTLFSSAVIVYLQQLSSNQTERLVAVYIMGVIASCVFEIAEVTVASLTGFDLVGFVFKGLSFNIPLSGEESNLYYQFGDFFRGNGFAGTNTQGVYIGTIIPLLIIQLTRKRGLLVYSYLVLALIALAITMSRTALVGAFVGLVVLGCFYFKRFPLAIPLTIAVVAPLFYLYTRFAQDINELASLRSGIDYSRLEIWEHCLGLSRENPMGIGLAQYFVLFQQQSSGAPDANTHNNWLSILVELGFIGLVVKMIFFSYVLSVMKRRPSPMSRASISCICAGMASAFTSDVLDLFFFQLLITLLFACCLVASQKRRRMPGQVKSLAELDTDAIGATSGRNGGIRLR